MTNFAQKVLPSIGDEIVVNELGSQLQGYVTGFSKKNGQKIVDYAPGERPKAGTLGSKWCYVQDIVEVLPKKISDAMTEGRKQIADDQRIFIEKLGFSVTTNDKDESLWTWTAPDSDDANGSYSSPKEALDGAWAHAIEQTLAISETSKEDWDRLDFDAQRVAMTLALIGELPSLSDLSPDTQMEWVEKVREVYPDIGPKEAFRFADLEFLENQGVMPEPKNSASLKG